MIIKKKRTGKPKISKPEIIKVQSEAGNLGYETLQENEPDFGMPDLENVNIDNSQSEYEELEAEVEQPQEEAQEPEEIDLFNLDNIDFSQRQERRRGDRRRGFRRVDERNLISRAREEADSIREAAAKEGYQEGLNQSSEDIAQVREAFKDFLSAPQEVFEYIAPDILEISIDIAMKLCGKILIK